MSMTREEAMKLLSYGDWWNHLEECLSTEEMQQLDDALFVVEKAIRPVSREQVEKMRGEWMFPIFAGQKDANDSRCQCSECGSIETPLARHRFCPACGAPMTDEAVQMVMERMEALHEAD